MRCGAGTTVAELDDALARHGQTVALPAWTAHRRGCVRRGRSGIRRLGLRPAARHLLQARLVTADGAARQGGRPHREERERLRPVPAARGVARHAGVFRRGDPRARGRGPMFSSGSSVRADPFELRRRLHRPTSLLWDGETGRGFSWRATLATSRPSGASAGSPKWPGRHPFRREGGGRSPPMRSARCTDDSSPKSESVWFTASTRYLKLTLTLTSSVCIDGSRLTSTLRVVSTPDAIPCWCPDGDIREARSGRRGLEHVRRLRAVPAALPDLSREW